VFEAVPPSPPRVIEYQVQDRVTAPVREKARLGRRRMTASMPWPA
jgi:hypothetical protein